MAANNYYDGAPTNGPYNTQYGPDTSFNESPELSLTTSAAAENFTLPYANISVDANNASGVAEIDVQRNGYAGDSATVVYTTANGTGTDGTQFTGTTTDAPGPGNYYNTLTFAPNQTEAVISVPTIDPTDTSDATFTVSLSSPSSNATLGAATTSTVNIVGLNNINGAPGNMLGDGSTHDLIAGSAQDTAYTNNSGTYPATTGNGSGHDAFIGSSQASTVETTGATASTFAIVDGSVTNGLSDGGDPANPVPDDTDLSYQAYTVISFDANALDAGASVSSLTTLSLELDNYNSEFGDFDGPSSFASPDPQHYGNFNVYLLNSSPTSTTTSSFVFEGQDTNSGGVGLTANNDNTGGQGTPILLGTASFSNQNTSSSLVAPNSTYNYPVGVQDTYTFELSAAGQAALTADLNGASSSSSPDQIRLAVAAGSPAFAAAFGNLNDGTGGQYGIQLYLWLTGKAAVATKPAENLAINYQNISVNASEALNNPAGYTNGVSTPGTPAYNVVAVDVTRPAGGYIGDAATVNYQLSSSSLYTGSSTGSVTIPAYQTVGTVLIPLAAGDATESSEQSFTMALTGATTPLDTPSNNGANPLVSSIPTTITIEPSVTSTETGASDQNGAAETGAKSLFTGAAYVNGSTSNGTGSFAFQGYEVIEFPASNFLQPGQAVNSLTSFSLGLDNYENQASTPGANYGGPAGDFTLYVAGSDESALEQGTSLATSKFGSAATSNGDTAVYQTTPGAYDGIGGFQSTVTLSSVVLNSTTTVTCASTADLAPGDPISGTGIPANTTVASISNPTTFLLSQAATTSTASGAYVAGTAGGPGYGPLVPTTVGGVSAPPTTTTDYGIPLGTFSFNTKLGTDYFTPSQAALNTEWTIPSPSDNNGTVGLPYPAVNGMITVTPLQFIQYQLNENHDLRLIAAPGNAAFHAYFYGASGGGPDTPQLQVVGTVAAAKTEESVGFGSTSYNVLNAAGGPSITIPVTRSVVSDTTPANGLSDQLTVTYTISNGNAILNTDYGAPAGGITGTLTFPALTSASTTQTENITIPIDYDAAAAVGGSNSGDKAFTVNLSSPGSNNSTNYATPSLANSVIGNSSGSTVSTTTVYITDSADNAETLTQYDSSTSPATAQLDGDIGTNGPVTFGPSALVPAPPANFSIFDGGRFSALDFNDGPNNSNIPYDYGVVGYNDPGEFNSATGPIANPSGGSYTPTNLVSGNNTSNGAATNSGGQGYVDFAPAASVAAINEISLSFVNYYVSGPGNLLDVYLVQDDASNIAFGAQGGSKNPHYYDTSTTPASGTSNINGAQYVGAPDGVGNQFGNTYVLGTIAYPTAQTAINNDGYTTVPLTQFNSTSESMLETDLNNGTKFRLVIAPEQSSTYPNADWIYGYLNSNQSYSTATGIPINYYIQPELSFDLSYASTSAPLPSYITPSANSDYVYNSSSGTLTLTSGTLTINTDPASDTTDLTPAQLQIAASGPTSVVIVNTTQITASSVSTSSGATVETAPSVTGVSPAAGPTAGNTTVTITGSNFTGATGVTFGTSSPVTPLTVTATQITAVDPAGTATVDVEVTTPVSTSSANPPADQFSYLATPAVTGVSVNGTSPASGPAAGGTTVTITGSNFTSATGVTFVGSPTVTPLTVTPTQITVVDPAGSGTVDVEVTTPGGTSAANPPADQFTYTASTAPTVVSVTPEDELGNGVVAGSSASGQRSMITQIVVVFSVPVDSLNSSAFTLGLVNNYGSGTDSGASPVIGADSDISGSLGTPVTTDGGTTWVIPIVANGSYSYALQNPGAEYSSTPTATSPAGVFASLANGVYHLGVNASAVTAVGGPSMASDYTSDLFHRLYGDMTNSETLNTTDVKDFGKFYGGTASAAITTDMDYVGSGVSNTTDVRDFGKAYILTYTYTPGT